MVFSKNKKLCHEKGKFFFFFTKNMLSTYIFSKRGRICYFYWY